MVIDIYGDFASRTHFFLPVIRILDRNKDIKINIIGPVHSSIKHIAERKYIKGDVALGIGMPREFAGMHAGDYKFKTGYLAWETNRVPYGSYYGLKEVLQKLDVLLVPDLWQAKLFEHVGPGITVLPLPIDTWLKPIKREADHKPFTFLCEGTLTLKHNVGLIISAFLSLYDGNPDYKLILKTDSGTLGHLSFPYENIEILDTIYKPEQYLKLVGDADCFIYPAAGESYPISLLNAMATDLPAITPSHSSFEDFKTLKLTDHELTPALRYSKKLENVGDYWSINYEELKELMDISNFSPLHTLKAAEEVGKVIRRKHSANAIANDIINMLRNSYND